MARNREQEVSFVYVIETQSVVSIGCHKVNLSRHILQRGDEDSPADQILFPQAFPLQTGQALHLPSNISFAFPSIS